LKKFALLIGLFFFITILKAQNLVPNPGFELFSECPTQIAQFKFTKEWFSGNIGTPEYLRLKCPFDKGGPHSGKGYAGAIFFCQYPKAIEYLMVKLSDTLVQDSTYCTSFWVRAEESFIYIDQIGMHLSKENLKIRMWAPIYVKPVLNSKYKEPIIPQLGWLQVKGEYKAEGGEEFLSIGNFIKPDRHIQHVDEFYGSFERGWNSYYYIDDVEVKLKSSQFGCKERIEIAELRSIESVKPKVSSFIVYFDIDKDMPTSLEKNNLLQNLNLMDLDSIEYIELIGHTDSIGTVDYNLMLSKKRISQIQYFIIANLSTKPSFKLNYFGELKPAMLNNTHNGRSKNRRVEIKVVYHDRKRK